jgi:transcription elongation factor GreA
VRTPPVNESRVDDALLMTREGYERLQQELLELSSAGRDAIADRLRAARADGSDPAENGELIDALNARLLLEDRIAALEARLARAEVVDGVSLDGVAGVGTRVRLTGDGGVEVEYALVGAGEADPARRRVSVDSPLGHALVGRRAGDRVDVQAPSRLVRYKLLAVRPLDAAAPMVASAA